MGNIQFGDVDGPASKTAFGPEQRLLVEWLAGGVVEHGPERVSAEGARLWLGEEKNDGEWMDTKC